MTIETLKSPTPRNRNGISVIKSKFLSVSSMNSLFAILKITDARRDVILAGGLYHRFPLEKPPPPPSPRWLVNFGGVWGGKNKKKPETLYDYFSFFIYSAFSNSKKCISIQ